MRDNLNCYYSYVRRNGSADEPDVGVSFSRWFPFSSTVELSEDTVLTQCSLYGHYPIYMNLHSPITVSDHLQKRLEKTATKGSKPLSVLFIVIDSVSRLNVERTMPRTRHFLLENGFWEYMGYNKMDDNTFPNFNALLTGMDLTMSYSVCQPDKIGMLDKCPMIWYHYRDNGYVTAYAEDWADLSTYNYQKKGFLQPPTDYYFKPYFDACRGVLYNTIIDTMPFYCGPETQGERVLNLAKDFAKTFKNKPKFGIFWMNTFSHENVSSPSRMDGVFEKFFSDFKSEGLLEDNMVVLLADHGMRFGPIRSTLQGWYEERLPVNFISVPSWFQQAFPEKYENLKKNSRKLTSTYDFYMTLQDVLAMSTDYQVKNSRACPSCTSFFNEIPEVRSCQEAGLPDVWCACLGKFKRTEDHEISPQFLQDAAKRALQHAQGKETVEPNSVDWWLEQTYRIITSAVQKGVNGQSYLLLVFEVVPHMAYQTLFVINTEPLEIVRLAQNYQIRI
ncbi:unnamed protein product [Acanthoscelides obtectus]|nr:unnamed protein product [Acanthoscelides obtectus]CAK1624781.1 hypothetical protein AOBTE_LOCUS2759 [Acanthoscelides obtectus]